MDVKQSRRLFYFLKRTVTLGGTGAYVVWQTGVFNEVVDTPSIKMGVWAVVAWAGFTLIRDYYKKATNEKNPDIGQISRATALFEMIPWILTIIIVGGIAMGIANMFQHVMVIASLQIGGKVFQGFELKYKLLEERGITVEEYKALKAKKKKPDEQEVVEA